MSSLEVEKISNLIDWNKQKSDNFNEIFKSKKDTIIYIVLEEIIANCKDSIASLF